MNRGLIAHLDAIEGRITNLLTQIMSEQQRQADQLTRVREDIAGMKVEHATHSHEEGS